MKRITIIGGGASGSLLAVNLIKQANAEEVLEINLIEKKDKLNRGLAYSTAQDVHLLNVPAGKMGAFPDDIGHFHKWLEAKNYQYKPADFAPRKIYGNYLNEVFNEALQNKNPNVSLNIFDGAAADVSIKDGKTSVVLTNGGRIESDKIVLAFGNFLPANLPTKNRNYIENPKYFRNAYDSTIVEKIASNDDVLLIGTGLTAVDNILSLNKRGHPGKIVMLSTHGWLPTVHAPAAVYESFENELKGEKNLLKIFKIVRRHCETAENWRSAIDSMRPYTSELWFNLPLKEKRRFMRHLRRLWDVSRHRIPPECANICDELQTAGKLEIISGKIIDIVSNDESFEVSFKHHGTEKSLTTNAIINCTGSQSNFEKLDSTLVKNLLAKGEIQTDALKMGLEAKPDGTIVNQNGEDSNIFLTLSTALKGILYESTAMPEIRVHARNLALKLLAGGKSDKS